MKPTPPSEQRPRAHHEATLKSEGLEACVHYRPVAGVCRLRRRAPHGKPEAICEAEGLILGVAGRSAEGVTCGQWASEDGAIDVYARGQETVMELPPGDACPLRLQAYWQIAESETLDLQVLIASERVVTGVEVHTETRLAADQVLARVTRNGQAEFIDVRRMAFGECAQVTFSRQRGSEVGLSKLVLRAGSPGNSALAPSMRRAELGATLFVYRLPGGDCSYVEMAHAEDVRQLRIEWQDPTQGGDTGSRANSFRTAFRLFGSELERGVILRTRMRAILLPRKGDLLQAVDLYERFLAEPPPLAV